MKDFINQVALLIKVHSDATAAGIDISEVVADRIRNLSCQLLAKGDFLVTMNSGKTQMMPVLNAGEIGLIHSKQKLEALKQYKFRNGFSLMESKYCIDQYMKNNGLT